MRLEQLQAFLAIAQTGSFQQAAKKCGVTQSTISRQIQGLEADLGVELFHRNTHAKLTLGGERLLPRVRKICQEWEFATQELTDLISGKQPELCVAAIHSICSSYLPEVLQMFCHNYPQVQLRVTSLGSDRSLKVLKDGLVDLAIVMYNKFLITGKEMVVKNLYEEPIEVLVGINHPLAEFRSIPWSELVKYPQVVFKDGYGMQRLIQEKFDQLGAVLKAALEVNTLDAFRGVVRQGKLIALLPHSALIEAKFDPSLVVRSLNNNEDKDHELGGDSSFTRRVVMVTTQDRLKIPPIEHFWQLVADHIPPKQSLS
ncbi:MULTISPECIES: LysR family transcriptional regulator [Cylindrospermopsis]|uniref:LysR family transcriptional regulator n=1 Tax=Cylindrospermopsis curvispora GIHE-G1 TaxID=2666332 RepID=A0A7H0EXY1_9CYAN|nr:MULTISPECIES: LysR family transcriptional regulator [Cylindrospermopsis]QNP28647.1 LysR family transcriptional regulator [Cylindrospermopsis curvispora GIHE-G1]TPX28645.1 LysR family transcriptional regulator [Cylindrospermopsis raciborskii GIHE 2018]UJS03532.1 LysR family transcriptional regulator [Cylindrospermopsis raciborskii KLL07]